MLQQNKDVFTWTHSDMPKIYPSIVSHRLNTIPSSRPIFQKIQHFHPNKQRIIQSEVDKLLAAGFIREVEYPDWVYGNKEESKSTQINKSHHRDVCSEQQEGVAMPHRSPSCTKMFHSPFHRQAKVILPHTKGASAIGWTDKCGREFYEVKSYLTQPLILSSPQSGEQLYMYLAMFDCAISVVLFHYIRDKEQRLVYYVNKAMVDVKTDTPRWSKRI
ncbi:hypothetical protein CK203_007408 [Vitis vinifera]|uniref:Reverse transcriptase/retrotransposon-derived protein RNase H-like domain-containing protein n=1 Tax=Vitis vinifera TaxID=29760 RepID=A0A438G1R4_VITVI|nr:hypothetical protein CK203_007408 [Vitis vinifera]